MRTSEVLNKAADLLQVDGWCQDAWQPPNKRCAISAITDAGGFARPHSNRAVVSLQRYLGLEEVSVWNDAPERTADEVIAALRACALVEAAKEQPEVVTPRVPRQREASA